MADSKDLEARLKAIEEEVRLIKEVVLPMLADIRGRLLTPDEV
ncbi:MAG: hypothetical protein WD208_00690 [Dehalococcoidia bacterium]